LSSDQIDAVSFTGSVDAGTKIAEKASGNLKKVVLELGGSDPFIVLEDANLEQASKTAARGRIQTCGQVCISPKRFIVQESVAEEFTKQFVEHMSAMNLGDPLDEKTDIGPLATNDVRIALERQVTESVTQGAKVLTGGKRPSMKGWFYYPTILGDVKPDMSVVVEETFGPVAPIIKVRDEDEAIKVANESKYGLGASLWTKDMERARYLARRIESGLVFVNETVKSDPRMPFGGIKKSGFGRELSKYGIHELTNIKTVEIF
jgi:acyl-CoA reductase-like NAD-dependent aldehyde dehydrogenase